MAAADHAHVPLLACLPLYRLLMHLRVVALSRRHRSLLTRIDDAIDTVVQTAELERYWTDHQVRHGQLLVHPLCVPPELDDHLPASVPPLAEARAQHQTVVRRLLLAVDHHPAGWRYLRAIHRWAPARWKKRSHGSIRMQLVWLNPASR